MKSGYRALAALCTLALSVNTGCAGTVASSDVSQDDSASVIPTGETTDTSTASAIYNNASDKDLSPSYEYSSTVTFSDSGAQCSGSGVSADGNVVIVSAAGSYSVSGSCNNGQIVIDCDDKDKVYLILNGLDLTCPSAPAILCKNADKLTITLNANTQNSISDGSEYSDEEADDTGAAIYSRETLVINGEGSLSVNGVFKDGIKSKDGVKLCGGNITVNAAEDGIIGKDYLLAAAGTISVTGGCDGLKSTNSNDSEKGYVSVTGGSCTIVCGNDGIQAETVLNISGGELNITSGGGSSTVEYTNKDDGFGMGHFRDFSTDGSKGFDFSNMTNSSGESTESVKGLKAGTEIIISGGTITADCADDTVHSNGKITITGGTFSLSSGDDGIHADELLTIESGDINIAASYEGLEAPGIEISGGTVSLVAYDDGLNANGSSNSLGYTPYITISGGSVTSNASGDGIDSNGTVSMSGGILVVFGPTDNSNGAIDYEQSFALSGGTLIALGSKGMAQAPSTLSQPCISIYSKANADSTIEVRDESGNAILSTVTPKSCESLIFSSPDFVSGSSYTIYADDELLDTVTATDGVSGGGASGSGFGAWSSDGDMPWGGGGHGGDHGGGGGKGGEKPDNFGDNDPGNMPDGFDPNNLPDGFDTDNLPDGFDPGSFDPNNKPNDMPDNGEQPNLPSSSDNSDNQSNA